MSNLNVSVQALVSKNQIMRALRLMTTSREEFDPGPWSLDDAETLEAAAALIRREIAEEQRQREARRNAT
jgi:hypothetical protein